MNLFASLKAFRRLPLALIACALLAAGCSTTKINWNERIGTYTYDQAVLEFGPPDKQATLQDGTIVAEWLTQRGYAYPAYGYNYYRSPYGYPGPVGSTYFESPNYYLRLTFGADRKLTASKSFAK